MRSSRASTSTATGLPFSLKDTGCVFATTRSSIARSALGAGGRRLQCAARHLPAHRRFVRHVAALVGCWIADAHGETRSCAEARLIEGLAGERRFRLAGPQRRRRHVGEADGDAGNPAALHLQHYRRGGRREVAGLALELLVRPAAASRRDGNADLSEDLIRRKLRCIQSEEISVRLDGTLT